MQLCQLAGDWRGKLPAGGAMAERKWDGIRAMRFRGIDGINRLFSRNGHTIEGTGHIAYFLDHVERVAGEPWFFDAEFVVDGTLAATKAWFERGWKAGGEAGQLYLFDGFPYRDWRAGGCDMPLYARKARLKALVDQVQGDEALSWEYRPGSRGDDRWATAVQMLADEWVFDAADVLGAARRVWAVEGEGIMLKDAEAPYQRNRNDAWLKVKMENFSKWRMAA